VRRVHHRPEKAHAYGLDLRSRELVDNLTDALLVERHEHFARDRHPLGHLEREPARHVRPWIAARVVELARSAALAEDEDVGVPVRRQVRRPRRRARQDRVDRARRGVHEQLAFLEQCAPRRPERFRGDVEGGQHPLDGVARHRRRLRELDPAVVVLDHEIGERATRVDREPHGATLAAARAAAVASTSTVSSSPITTP
jgi:hypothetical protein